MCCVWCGVGVGRSVLLYIVDKDGIPVIDNLSPRLNLISPIVIEEETQILFDLDVIDYFENLQLCEL